MKIEVCPDGIELIVRTDLKNTLSHLESDLKKRKKGEALAIFSLDAKEDMYELQRHIDAFKLVLRYYGEA